ncbi:MAG: endolytic transglycosylase MltG [Eubacterium sp.]|nr:endolytic transglycosylase MltG [Eubacterium sp.]MDD7208538.1 endolytic transglycosylase MltG [Lachnospiraceae bacterium]MDY5498171.1 endolytic transglycosylase MltG [Anaerobutyricum sp.]
MRKEDEVEKDGFERKLEIHFMENVEEPEETLSDPQKPQEEPSRKRRYSGQDEEDGETVWQVTGEAQPERKSRRARKIVGLLLVFLLAGTVAAGYPIAREYFQEKSVAGKEVEVTIKKGSTSRDVGQLLKEKGLIRYKSAFLLKLYFSEYKGKIRYGTFELNKGMSLARVIKELATQDGQKENAFTVPEGYSIEMIAKKLEKEKVMPASEFLTAATKAAQTSHYKGIFPDKTRVYYQLQGYLYPDTYYLPEKVTGDQLVSMMLDEFDKKFDTARLDKAKSLGLTVEEVLIRASLVQKETENPKEYPTIAGVINNRLTRGMKLQFDSTVVYAITKGAYGMERVLYKDLEFDSPYNTYKNAGLPAGPICNPCLAAIDGVLNPQQHDFLYFQTDVTKNDGSNIYTKTYEEHAAASSTTTAVKKETGPTDTKKNK